MPARYGILQLDSHEGYPACECAYIPLDLPAGTEMKTFTGADIVKAIDGKSGVTIGVGIDQLAVFSWFLRPAHRHLRRIDLHGREIHAAHHSRASLPFQ